jgi:hypothetical protein
LGFSQITRITPFRFTILHLSQIFLTEALTFTISTSIYSATPCGGFTTLENPAIYGEDGEKIFIPY